MKTPEQAAQEAARRLFGEFSHQDTISNAQIISDFFRPFAEEIARQEKESSALALKLCIERDRALAQLSAAREEIARLNSKLDPSTWTVVDDSSRWTMEEALEMHRRKAERVNELTTQLAAAREEIARLTERQKWLEAIHGGTLKEHLKAFVKPLEAQLAAARDTLQWYATAQYPDDGSGRPPDAYQRRAKAFLATPCPAAEALVEDRARLDWLERQSNGSSWVARQSVTGRGFRLHNTGADDSWNGAECRGTARAAIDAARAALSTQAGLEGA